MSKEVPMTTSLRAYVQHKTDCAVTRQSKLRAHSHGEHDFVDPPRWQCDCGLAAAVADAESSAPVMALPLDPPVFVDGQETFTTLALVSFVLNGIRLRGRSVVAASAGAEQEKKDYRQATQEERAMARGFVTLWESVGVQDAEDWLYVLRNRAELLASLDEDVASPVPTPETET